MDRAHLRLLAATLALLAAPYRPAEAQEGESVATRCRAFLDDHCVACHGPERQRSRLRLDRLPPAFDDPDATATWVKVLDRVASGEMPPKGRPRPPEDAARAVVAGLRQALHDASLARFSVARYERSAPSSASAGC